MKRYLSAFELFSTWLQFDGEISLNDMEPFHIADFLTDTVKPTSDWSYKPSLNALTWVARILGLKALTSALQSPLVQSFFNSKQKPPLNPNILPITMGMAYILEKAILDSGPDPSIMPIGTFLVMFWSGLRYSDAQRIKLADLTISSGLLRGRTWKSKNAKSGMAFACITSGLCGTHSKNWATKWLQFTKQWWARVTEQHNIEVHPDFLLPMVHPKSGVSSPRPMAHYQAAIWLRLVLWLSHGIKPTLHGLKAGLIAVGKQLTLPEEWLSEQGHHSHRTTTGTYTRDDTFFQLRLQVAIMKYVQKGWRPTLAQDRGSSKPMVDIPFTCLDCLTWDWLFLDDGITEFRPKQKDKSALSIIETEKN